MPAGLTDSVRSPVVWSTTHVTGEPAGGVQAIAPRFASVPSPVFVTVTVSVVGVVMVPLALATNETLLALTESTGCRIVKLTVTFCGLLVAPVAETGTVTGAVS